MVGMIIKTGHITEQSSLILLCLNILSIFCYDKKAIGYLKSIEFFKLVIHLISLLFKGLEQPGSLDILQVLLQILAKTTFVSEELAEFYFRKGILDMFPKLMKTQKSNDAILVVFYAYMINASCLEDFCLMAWSKNYAKLIMKDFKELNEKLIENLSTLKTTQTADIDTWNHRMLLAMLSLNKISSNCQEFMAQIITLQYHTYLQGIIETVIRRIESESERASQIRSSILHICALAFSFFSISLNFDPIPVPINSVVIEKATSIIHFLAENGESVSKDALSFLFVQLSTLIVKYISVDQVNVVINIVDIMLVADRLFVVENVVASTLELLLVWLQRLWEPQRTSELLLVHLYCSKVLQGYPRDETIIVQANNVEDEIRHRQKSISDNLILHN